MGNQELLNIGCGKTAHPDWVNVDMVALLPGVLAHDLRCGIPFEDSKFDGCYCSHMLEHVTKEQARVIVGESFRILKKGGVARFVVPDLEQIVRLYLNTLEQITSGHPEREADYDWMMLELLDQTVRSYPGGEMGKYLNSESLPNKMFIKARIGLEAERVWGSKLISRHTRITAKLKSLKLSWFIYQFRIKFAGLLVRVFAGTDAKNAFYEGVFRSSGEIHCWMYDRYSLHRLLAQAGFTSIKLCKADESSIPNFDSYNLDLSEKFIRKPDSIYMEAMKP